MAKTKIQGRKYPRRAPWRQRSKECIALAGGLCAFCREAKATTADHVLPERFLRFRFPGKDVHALINLLPACRSCHGIKTGVDRCLWRVMDILGFISGLKKLNAPMDKVYDAMAFYGLTDPRVKAIRVGEALVP